MNNKQYHVPPRLNQKYLLFGCTVLEWFLILALFIVAMLKLSPLLMAFPALIFACSARFINGEMNGRDLVKLLYKYYAKQQIFSLRGGK